MRWSGSPDTRKRLRLTSGGPVAFSRDRSRRQGQQAKPKAPKGRLLTSLSVNSNFATLNTHRSDATWNVHYGCIISIPQPVNGLGRCRVISLGVGRLRCLSLGMGMRRPEFRGRRGGENSHVFFCAPTLTQRFTPNGGVRRQPKTHPQL